MSRVVHELPGVVLGQLRRFPDSRGSFAEAWRASGGPGADPFPAVQANLSSSKQGVLRGLHVHRRQWDQWIVLAGTAFVALVDLREMVAGTSAEPNTLTTTLGRDQTLVIPPGVAHGFLAIEPLELLYIATNEYDGTDELGFAWDDPLVGVSWPEVAGRVGRPVVSSRDNAAPSVLRLVEHLRA